jgi:hypothetical protein
MDDKRLCAGVAFARFINVKYFEFYYSLLSLRATR